MLHEQTLAATSETISMGGINIPCTITLHSSSGTRKIELSANNGIDFFQPPIDASSTGFIVTSVLSQITHIKVTGLINDTFTVAGS